MKEASNETTYYIQKEELMKQSDYFNMIASANSDLYVEKQTKEIVLKNVDYIAFYQVLFYCYNKYIPDETSFNMYDWISLLFVSSQFLFNDIFKYCEYKLKELSTKENIIEIYEYANVI